MKRNTVQRQIILSAISELASHPTAEEVYAHVVKIHPTISKATVYRNLAQAAKSGEISDIGTFDGATRYDHNTHNHFHFVCEDCKELMDVPDFDFGEYLNSINGLTVKKVELTLRGVCKNCKE